MSYKNLLHLWDLTEKDIVSLLDSANQLKKDYLNQGANEILKGRTAVLFFEKPSLRTRVTFEVAMNQMGGSALILDPSSVGFNQRETVEDAVKSLSRWIDVIVARTFKQSLIEEISFHSSIPVINALSDLYHPCQALAFAQTAREKLGSLKGKTLVFVGDQNNVFHSLAILAAKLQMNCIWSGPSEDQTNSEVISKIKDLFNEQEGCFSLVKDPERAVCSADVIYTDVWVSMGDKSSADNINKLKPYQLNALLLSKAPETAFISHCLPAHRGEEITDEVMKSDKALCFDEAENRLHIQKAILLSLILSP